MLRVSRFDRWMILILVILAAGLGGIALFSSLAGLRQPELRTPLVGVYGPVGVTFAQKMQPASVQSRWQSEPPVSGRFSWEGQTAWFWPETALNPDVEYRFRLEGGALGEDGQMIRSTISWRVQVRSTDVVYLSPAVEGSEIWKSGQDGSARLQLTHTGNQVYDFGVSYSGDWIAFSRLNSQRGSDLWVVKRDGSEAHKIVDCNGDSCIQPAWSADGSWVAYSRRRLSVAKDEPYSPSPRIWMWELVSGKTSALFQDPAVGGENPTWSPDGKRLAFFDPPAHVIHVLDIETGKEWMLQSQLGAVGNWSADGKSLWYSDLDPNNLMPLGSGYVANVLTGQIQRLFANLVDSEDFGLPVPSPDGNWVVVGVRLSGGSHSVQLHLLRPDGTQRQKITSDPVFSHGAYHWDPGGKRVLYQRVQVATSRARPEVWIWEQSSGVARKLASDAALPVWLP
jgi:Tol biopolymer transport system component